MVIIDRQWIDARNLEQIADGTGATVWRVAMMLGRDDWTEATRQIPRRNRYGRTDNDRMDHLWGLFKNRYPPTRGEGFLGRRPWRKDGLTGMPEALGYFVATSCRRFSAAALRPARSRRGGPADAGC
jgi:hypothetical protein